MNKNLINLIECKKCQCDFNLNVKVEKNKKVKEGNLICPTCNKTYKITNFIPKFVEDEQYVESFGDEWTIFNNVKNKSKIFDNDIKNYLALNKEDIKGKRVLEIGCGTGPYLQKNAQVADEIIGIDLSRAVESSQKNVGHLPNVTIMQADLFNLPFKEGVFDVVYSLGVLHHTPNTHKAFKSIVPYVRKNGILSIWLYGAYWPRKYKNAEIIRNKFTYKLSKWQLLLWCKMLSYFYYLYKIPILGNGLREVLPIDMSTERNVRVCHNYDMYSPTYVHTHSLNEVYTWFKDEEFYDMEPSNWIVGMKAYKR